MKKILIVEDEKMIRYGIHVMIENSDVPCQSIDECRNGKEALAFLEKARYDLVLTDIKMPVMNGIELVQWIKEHFEKDEMPPVAAISGYAEFDYVRSIMKGGAIDYILKPVDREELKKVLWHAEEIYKNRCRSQGIHEDIQEDGETLSYINRKKMEDAIDYIYRNYRKPIDMAEVSNHISMNYTMFSSEFKKYTGQNFSVYLKNLRIEKARKLMRDTDMKINEIGLQVGFEDARRFAKVFKEETGMTPRQYREGSRVNNL